MVMASLSVDSEEETSLDLQDGAPFVDYAARGRMWEGNVFPPA